MLKRNTDSEGQCYCSVQPQISDKIDKFEMKSRNESTLTQYK